MQQNCSVEQARIWSLSGGEDYELCFTIPEVNRGALEVALAHTGANFTCIGQIKPQSEGISYYCDNQAVDVALKGFDHFALTDVNS